MESEKVKEIRKALECNADCKNYNRLPYTDGHKCKTVGFWDILTYINEIESENERLKHLREVDNTTMTTLRKSNTELNECMDEMQDRIAELEKENETKTDTITDLFKKQEFYEKEKLKQFAERLKENLEEYRLENEYFTEHEPNGNLWQMNSSVFCIEVTQEGGLVDETLKEFLL